MKRLLVFLMVLLLAGSAFAETAVDSTTASAPAKHDMSIFESMENYEYDKFDKDWTCHGAYSMTYTDAIIVLGIQIEGADNGPAFIPHLYAWIRTPDNASTLFDVTGIDILIGDTLYSYPKWQVEDAFSLVYLAENNGKALVEAMAAADEISFRLNFATGSTSLDIPVSQYSTTLKPMAQALIDFDIWSYIDDPRTADWERAYPLTIQ